VQSKQSQELWAAVDDYFEQALAREDEALASARRASGAAGLPPHQVSACQGKLLTLLAMAARAKNILEIGTLGGYSTVWLARGLAAGGRLVTLEVNPRHAEVARENLARAGLADVVRIVVGSALETLPALAEQGAGPFDLVFIDADKVGNAEYLAWALKLSRPGTLIVADNVVRGGAVIDAASDDPSVKGIRRFVEALADDPRVSSTAIQTVGGKGYDGLALAVVLSAACP
jgi:predicted O-methyltransferase YrrM